MPAPPPGAQSADGQPPGGPREGADDHDDRGDQNEQKLTETVPTVHKPDDADVDVEGDVVSDPARDDHLGSDWQDEGGATAEGPATAPYRKDGENGQADERPNSEPDPDPDAEPEREDGPKHGVLPAITLDPPD